MRILVCAAEAPLPPINGARLQLRHLCEELAPRHEITVVAYRRPDQDGEAPAGVDLRTLDLARRSTPARAGLALRAAVLREPRAALMLAPRMARELQRMSPARDFDVAHVAGSQLAPLAPALGGLPAILAALDAWHLNVAAAARTGPVPLRILRRVDLDIARRFSATAYRPFAGVVMVSEEDARAARALDPTLRVDVVPNGVDTEHFAPDPGTIREPGLIVMTGAMQWAPNVEAARLLATAVLPRVRARRPDARLAIVGRAPAAAVLRLAELEHVEVTGEVPDLRPWLRRAEVFAAPMVSGTGIKNKLLEALACGTPSVATPLACQGLRMTHAGGELLVASTVDELAGAIVTLLDDPDLRARLGLAGRAAVVEHHGWRATAAAYEAIYQRAIGAGRKRERSGGERGARDGGG
jgi:glycosyltransferase involved in cell wall biosynthesis